MREREAQETDHCPGREGLLGPAPQLSAGQAPGPGSHSCARGPHTQCPATRRPPALPSALRGARTPRSPTTCQLLPNLLLPFWRSPTWESSRCVRQEAELGCDWSLSLLPKSSPSCPADHTSEKPLTPLFPFTSAAGPPSKLAPPTSSSPALPLPQPPPPPAPRHQLLGPEASDGPFCLPGMKPNLPNVV